MVEQDDSIFGTDYSSKGGVTCTGDIELVTGLENAKQNIHNQLLTQKGFYPSVDNEWGSELFEALGEDFEEQSIDAIIIYIQNALYENPRVQTIQRIEPYTTVDKKLNIILEVSLVNGTDETMNLDLGEFE